MDRYPGQHEFNIALPGELIEATRQATTRYLHSIGLPIETWDPELVGQLDIPTEDSQIFGDLKFEGSLTYEASILGYTSFRLITSHTSDRYGQSLVTSDRSDSRWVADVVEAPVKSLRIELYKAAEPSDPSLTSASAQASIFLFPDAPPMAVHDNDLQYVVRKNQSLDLHGPAAVQAVITAFGEESAAIISNEAAGTVILALRRTHCRVMTDADYTI